MFNIYNIRIEFLFSEQYFFSILNIINIIMIGGLRCQIQRHQKQLKK